MSRAKTCLIRRLAPLAFTLVAGAALLEALVALMLAFPRVTAASPGPLRHLIREIYHSERDVIQFDPRCGRYDSELSYTLRPGTCIFENVEFRNAFRVNRLGLRDGEDALVAPEVIVLGDSQAMGWGVDQDQSMVRVLARASGLKVLNAAISSYGTVRERELLDRLDTSRLNVLVVQYSSNDVLENLPFSRQGRLHTMSRPHYDEIVRENASRRSYFPGRYVSGRLLRLLRAWTSQTQESELGTLPPSEEARLFLDALERAGRAPLGGLHLVAFDVSAPGPLRSPFVAALDLARLEAGRSPFVRELTLLDTAGFLTPDDFYTLDDHLNASGHRKIGEALAARIREVLGPALASR